MDADYPVKYRTPRRLLTELSIIKKKMFYYLFFLKTTSMSFSFLTFISFRSVVSFLSHQDWLSY